MKSDPYQSNNISILDEKYEMQTYHFGIIDYLQKWNVSKKLERIVKSMKNFNHFRQISAQPPKDYSDRFINFITHNVLKPSVEHVGDNEDM